MDINECRLRNCAYVSTKRRVRSCGVVDCSRYPTLYQERWWVEEEHEFEHIKEEEQ